MVKIELIRTENANYQMLRWQLAGVVISVSNSGITIFCDDSEAQLLKSIAKGNRYEIKT